MEKNKKNRGKSAEDDGLFQPENEQLKIKTALNDLHYLLSRKYPIKSSLALVGSRYKLRTRQLLALQGMACAESDMIIRKQKEIPPTLLHQQNVYLDGFNVLIVLESFFSGAYVFKGQDGCYRDLSSVHGTYKRVNQTEDVLLSVGRVFNKFSAGKITWVFDKPVSNSGKMKSMCLDVAKAHNFNWNAILENVPDKYLAETNGIICSSDAWILNECTQWYNLTAHIIEEVIKNHLPQNIITP